jgi:hypothetical protein
MDRHALEGAAAKYWYLRGLLYIPGGLAAIVAALGNEAVGPFAHDWVFVAAIALLGVAALLINRYYNDHYGRLRPSSALQARGLMAAAVAIAVMVGGAMLLRGTSLNAIAVPFAAVMLISYAVGVGLKLHHVVIWGGVLVAGALPVWSGSDSSNAGLVMAGVALMVCGLFDHRLFVRTFGPASLPAHARA